MISTRSYGGFWGRVRSSGSTRLRDAVWDGCSRMRVGASTAAFRGVSRMGSGGSRSAYMGPCLSSKILFILLTRGTGHAETRDRTGVLQIFSLTLSQLSYRGFWAGRLGFGPSLGTSVNRDQPRPSCGPGWEQPRSLLAGRLPHRWPGARASPGTASQRLTARPETFCQST